MTVTIAKRSIDTGGRSTGFDYLRIALALGVIFWHSFALSYGSHFIEMPVVKALKILTDPVLPMFFALSGYLVAGSLERNSSIITFVGLRAIRILPALAVEVLLSALLLGSALTVLPRSEYFADPKFWAYFLNIAGDIHFHLPGLFLSNPYPDVVNGQLWTVPWELRCYIVLTLLAIAGITARRGWFAITTVVLTGILWGAWGAGLVHYAGVPLLMGFLAGVVIYQFGDALPWDWRLGLIAGALTLAMLQFPALSYAIGFPAAYFTVWLGLMNPRKITLLRGADYSYGLYLYGFAIQQAVIDVLPWSREWYLNLILSVPLACAFAAGSWHLIEKPALRARKFLPHLEALASRRSKFRSGLPDEA